MGGVPGWALGRGVVRKKIRLRRRVEMERSVLGSGQVDMERHCVWEAPFAS